MTESLDRVLAGLGSPPASSLQLLIDAWPEIVGPAAAEALTPVAIHDGTLLVEAVDPRWAGQARWLESNVVEAAARLLGPDVVRDLRARTTGRKG